MKKRILFFMADDWSFGRFFTDLSKYLFQYNFDCVLMDYSKVYHYDEFHNLAKLCDWVVTTPSGVKALPSYNVPYDKMIMIMFHSIDVEDVRRFGLPYDQVHKVCAISEQVKALCRDFTVPISVVEFGINAESYRATPSQSLTKVGFSGAYLTRAEAQKALETNYLEPRFFKRGYLAKEAAEHCGLEFVPAIGYPYQTMPGYYASVDAILCCSTDEGASGSVLEGGAAGRLIITTNVGGWASFVTDKGAHGIPVSEEQYLESAIELLNYYKNNPEIYRKRCYEIQEYCLQKYHLGNYLNSWIMLLSGY